MQEPTFRQQPAAMDPGLPSLAGLSGAGSPEISEALLRVRPVIEKWLSCTFMDEAEECQREIGALEPTLDVPLIEMARVWAWQAFTRDANTFETIAGLYMLVQRTDRMSLGPTACRYCSNLGEVEKQVQNYRAIMGENLEQVASREPVVIRYIDDYQVRMHLHDCEFGSGLICYSMFRGPEKLYQISFYPSPVPVLYEIKGATSKDPAHAKAIKRGVLRFKSKFGRSPAAELALTFLETTEALGTEAARIIARASLWRNFGIARDPERRARADRQYERVAAELDLSFPPVDQALCIAMNDIKWLYDAHGDEMYLDFEKNGIASYHGRSVLHLLRRAHAPVADTIPLREFVFKAVSSRHAEDLYFSLRSSLYRAFEKEFDLGTLQAQAAGGDASLNWYPPFAYEIGAQERVNILRRFGRNLVCPNLHLLVESRPNF